MRTRAWPTVTRRGALTFGLATATRALAAAPADTLPAWTHRKPIVLPASMPGGYVEVLLDPEVYRDAAPALADLRIRDQAGAEVAYVLRRHERGRTWQERDVRLLDLEETPSGETRFVLDLGGGPKIHNRVRIRTGTEPRNFRVPVRIETSADRRQWQLVRAAGFIYVVEGETRAADTTVSYPPSTARHVRVTITPTRGRPVPVAGAAVIVETPADREEDVVPATIVERREDAEHRATRLVLDVGGRRPVDRAELEITDRTFHRVAIVEASENRREWRWIASGALSAVETARVRERQTSLRFPESATPYIRLTIQNLDDRPLTVAAARLATVRRGLVFQPRPGQAYALDYGHPGVAAPRYDLARAFPYLQAEPLPLASLGPAVVLPPPPPAAKPWTEGRPLLLWGAMGVAALGLGGLLLRLAREIPPPPRGD